VPTLVPEYASEYHCYSLFKNDQDHAPTTVVVSISINPYTKSAEDVRDSLCTEDTVIQSVQYIRRSEVGKILVTL